MADDPVRRISPTAEVEALVRELIDEIRVLKGRVAALEARPVYVPPVYVQPMPWNPHWRNGVWCGSATAGAGNTVAASSTATIELSPETMLFDGQTA